MPQWTPRFLVLGALLTLGLITGASFADADKAAIPTAEVVASFEIRPGNPSLSPDGRILLSLQPLANPPMKVMEVLPSGKGSVYPNARLALGDGSELRAVIGIRTDDQGVAWILDLGAKRFLAWDTRLQAQVKTILIPEEVLRPASFLQDFALDQKRNRAIIADMTQGDLTSAPVPAFVVVDLESGEAQRVAESHPSMMPEMDGGFGLNPITIDPDYEFVYFGALHGRTLYRVPAASFDDTTGAKVAATIERYAPKSYSDGITVDSAGNVYVTDVETHTIGIANPDGYAPLVALPEGQSWPDGLTFGPDGYLYGTVNQLDRTAALSGKETGTPPYLLVRFKPAAPSTTGR